MELIKRTYIFKTVIGLKSEVTFERHPSKKHWLANVDDLEYERLSQQTLNKFVKELKRLNK